MRKRSASSLVVEAQEDDGVAASGAVRVEIDDLPFVRPDRAEHVTDRFVVGEVHADGDYGQFFLRVG